MRRTGFVVLVLMAVLAATSATAAPVPTPATPAVPAGPQLYLSWGAPYGMPGARDALVSTCNDTTRADTLYLSFELEKDAPALAGMGGTLFFWPQEPETLGTFWHFSREGENTGNALIEFYPPPAGVPSPFTVPGMGAPSYRYNGHAGRLDIIYAVPRHAASAVKARTPYFFAKLIIRHTRTGLTGCGRPLCVEWSEAKIALGLGGSQRVTAGQRFVIWNARGAAVCKEHAARPAQEFGAPTLPDEGPGPPRQVPLKLGEFKPAGRDSATKQ